MSLSCSWDSEGPFKGSPSRRPNISFSKISMVRRNNTRTFRNSARRATRPRGNMSGLRMSSTRVNGSPDPPPVEQCLDITKRWYIVVPKGTYNMTPKLIISSLPGYNSTAQTSIFERIRIEKISVYGEEPSQLRLNVTDGDGAKFVDDGTAGERRPQLHIQPDFQLRSKWYKTTDTTTIFAVGSDTPVQTRVFLTIQAVAPGGSDF